MIVEFKSFQKVARLSREIIVTEKIDGTNGLVYVGEDGEVLAGSRNRWLTLTSDNHGFAQWVLNHVEELRGLGPGFHYGEWWGVGIGRAYGLSERRFSLFNVSRWRDGSATPRPTCCRVVPELYQGPFTTDAVEEVLASLQRGGSHAAPGFMRPEGVVIFHGASGTLFKKTLEKDGEPKGKAT